LFFNFIIYDLIFFLCQIWLLLFSNLHFFSFLSLFSNLFFFSSLSLITFVSWEFYIVIFLGLFFILWSSLMIRVTSSEGWTELVIIIFFNFIHHHWVPWKLIFFVFLHGKLSRYYVLGHGFSCSSSLNHAFFFI